MGDIFTDGNLTMGVHPRDGRIVYYDSADGISITTNTGTSDVVVGTLTHHSPTYNVVLLLQIRFDYAIRHSSLV